MRHHHTINKYRFLKERIIKGLAIRFNVGVLFEIKGVGDRREKQKYRKKEKVEEETRPSQSFQKSSKKKSKVGHFKLR